MSRGNAETDDAADADRIAGLPPYPPSLPPNVLLTMAVTVVKADPTMLKGYVIGLQVAAGVCRSHIASAKRKYGDRSDAVRLARADLCCIERELRRCRVRGQQINGQETA